MIFVAIISESGVKLIVSSYSIHTKYNYRRGANIESTSLNLENRSQPMIFNEGKIIHVGTMGKKNIGSRNMIMKWNFIIIGIMREHFLVKIKN